MDGGDGITIVHQEDKLQQNMLVIYLVQEANIVFHSPYQHSMRILRHFQCSGSW